MNQPLELSALKWMEDYWITSREAFRWRLSGAAIKPPYAASGGNSGVVNG
ncbi:hypothetical protein [Nitritalea halalkaliphila]|nr:hypothetical protein [Nitritalea halalkaliphila]